MEEENNNTEEVDAGALAAYQAALKLMYVEGRALGREQISSLTSLLLQRGYYPRIPSLLGHVGKCTRCFRKILTPSDVDEKLARLLIKTEFATKIINKLSADMGNPVQGIKVVTFDYWGNEHAMEYKLWAKKLYVLTSGWKSFYQYHELKALQHEVSLWAFRHAQHAYGLCFAITFKRV